MREREQCAFGMRADHVRGQHERIFFLEADGEIAGSAGMVTCEPGSLVFINLVIMKEQFRRRGYAARLIGHILDLTRN